MVSVGLHQALIKLGWRVQECGNLSFPPPQYQLVNEEALGGKANQCHAGW